MNALRALIDFTLSHARRFYSSMGNPLDEKGSASIFYFIQKTFQMINLIKRETNISTPHPSEMFWETALEKQNHKLRFTIMLQHQD